VSPCIALPPERARCLAAAACGRDSTGSCSWSPSCDTVPCLVSGCNREICADEDRISICIGYPQSVYECLGNATCARRDGICSWDRQCLPSATPVPVDPLPTPPCVVSGCSSEICADDNRVSTCIGYPQSVYDCLRNATCARRNGICSWDRQCLP
jgi:hypothetical protein